MKPAHRTYCRDCGRKKILFETEKKALNFIKWNADEIEEESGYRPHRAYFCDCCGGWHVTSMVTIPHVSRTDKIIEQFKKSKNSKKIKR